MSHHRERDILPYSGLGDALQPSSCAEVSENPEIHLIGIQSLLNLLLVQDPLNFSIFFKYSCCIDLRTQMSTHAPQEASRATTTTQSSSTTTVTLKSRTKKKAVQWTEDVVDNEGMGKRSSKSMPKINDSKIIFEKRNFWPCSLFLEVCCVFTPPEDWDASGSESDSSSDEEHTCTHPFLYISSI